MSPRFVRSRRAVLEHRGRLDRRVILKPAASVGTERRGTGVGPHVRAPPAALAEVDVVHVRGVTFRRLPMPALVLAQTMRFRDSRPSLVAAA
jgi:hypothetical protein